MKTKDLERIKKELAANEAHAAARALWLQKHAGCAHAELQVSISHPASGASISRCKSCGVQVESSVEFKLNRWL